MVVDAERRDIGGGDLQVRRHAHLRHRDQRVGDDRITHLTALQDLGDGGAHLFADAQACAGTDPMG
jgi:hypothetical protein